MTGKKKRCFLCGEEAPQTRNFPPQSRPLLQKEWLLRQNKDAEGTNALHNKHLTVKEPRWCLRHFSSPSDELPIDHRLVRVRPLSIQTIPLRTTRPADLVHPSQFNAHMSLDTIRGVNASLQSPLTPLSQSSTRNPPWSPRDLGPSMEDDPWNDNIDEVLPKRFKSGVSTNTMATIESKGSDYQYSQDSAHSLDDEETEIEEEEEQSSIEMGRYAVVEAECLWRLLKWCEECGARLDESLIEKRRVGSAWVATYDCLACNATVIWNSQKMVGKGRGQVHSFNHAAPIAAYTTGTPLPRLCDFAKLLELDLPSDRIMRKTIHDIGSIAIERVFSEWQETARELAVNVAEGKALQVSIDGQFDSPGHTASNARVTVIDCETRLALVGVAMHKTEKGIDGISCRMESEGALRALVELLDNGIEIRTRVTDQNGMVDKRLREHPKTAHIEMALDWWHVQKPVRKEWWKLVKDNPDLAPFYQAFFNHLYYVHNKYPNKVDRPHALEVVQSFVMHIQGKHKWKKSAEFQMVTKCEHGRLKPKKKGEKRLRLKAGSNELELIKKMVFAPKFAKAFISAASLIDTAINECFHSLSLMYSPKRFASSHFHYELKTKVSLLHYNSLMLDDLLGKRSEIGNTVLTRKGRLVVAVKRKRGLGTHSWRMEIMEESIRVREEQGELRAVRRMGIPEDTVFDELTNWWEEKERLALVTGYEQEEDGLDFEDSNEEGDESDEF